MKFLTECPVCLHHNFADFQVCRDYTVSHETFQLQQCPSCSLVFTNPRPDDDQLHKYYESENYVSHADKAANFVDSIYHIARSFTLKWKHRLLVQHAITTPHTVLDFGCGTGSFLSTCKQKGLQIAGVEPSLQARTIAATTTGEQIAQDLRDITGTHDVITLWHVLEHVTDLNETISSLSARLAENGTMFIAVPNLKSDDAAFYRAHWAGFDVPRHLWHFSQQAMTRLLANHNLNIAGMVPMRLDAFYVSLLSEQYLGRKAPGTFISAIARGLRSNFRAGTTNEFSSLIYIVRK